MGRRLKLHEELQVILKNGKVYFQPPASVKMSYPCIRYKKDTPYVNYAGDNFYNSIERYEITVIDPDPDSNIANEIRSHFKTCAIARTYTSDNLNHTVLTLYY